MNILIKFNCTCGWKEDIGVDVYSGVLIRGAFTLFCPSCGSVTHLPDVAVAMPAKLHAVRVRSQPIDPMDRA